ncbi:hypothetical protein Tco_1431178 [Tanacetum coccineum]
MGDEKKEALAMCNHNSVTEPALALADSELKTSYKCIRSWVAKQTLPLKVVVRDVATTLEATFQGACRGFVIDVLYCKACSKLGIPPPSSQEGNLEQIRIWAVMVGVNAAYLGVGKNIKGRRMSRRGFGYGVALSLVTGMRGPRVMSVGVICALISGGLFKDALHNKKKGGFSSLGIGFDHAMNFNKDLFTYNSLPLFSDRQVRKMCIEEVGGIV